MEKGKEKIRIEWQTADKTLGEKDTEAIKACLRDGVKEIGRDPRQKPVIGIYRGFEVLMIRSMQASGEGFRLSLRGAGEQEFQPENLIYSFEEKFSLSGMFQRLDNFLETGLEKSFNNQRISAEREIAEIDTVTAALGQEFPQKEELTLTRDNHSAIIRELQRMQDDAGYVGEWKPKTLPPEPIEQMQTTLRMH